jgi:hypothetical protein
MRIRVNACWYCTNDKIKCQRKITDVTKDIAEDLMIHPITTVFGPVGAHTDTVRMSDFGLLCTLLQYDQIYNKINIKSNTDK